MDDTLKQIMDRQALIDQLMQRVEDKKGELKQAKADRDHAFAELHAYIREQREGTTDLFAGAHADATEH